MLKNLFEINTIKTNFDFNFNLYQTAKQDGYK